MLSAITDVFDQVADWIQGAVGGMTEIFYNATDSSLTLLGILAVCGLAFSVVFLLIGIIQKFLHFGG